MKKFINDFFNNEKRYLTVMEFKELKFDDVSQQIVDDEDAGSNPFNSFFRLWEEALYLQNEKENKNEIAFCYFLMSYHLCMWSHPPNAEIFGQFLIQKAIDLDPDDGKLELYEMWRLEREMTENWEGIDFDARERESQKVWDKFDI